MLDLCIREGGDSPELYFEAAMRAHNLGMYELLVSYLNTFLERYPPMQWVHYYLAIGLLETKKPKESLESIQKEIDEFKGAGIHVESIIAAANSQLGNSSIAAASIEKTFKMPLYDIDDLTSEGISSALERLWRAAKIIGNQNLVQRMEERLLRSGFAPEEYFVEQRASQKPKDLNLFHVTILQPLDEDWQDSLDRLPDQEGWSGYIAHWGVLAEDEIQAEELVLKFQAICSPIEPEVMEVEMGEEPLHDRMGVVFQGVRMSADDLDELDDEDDEDDEDYDPEDWMRIETNCERLQKRQSRQIITNHSSSRGASASHQKSHFSEASRRERGFPTRSTSLHELDNRFQGFRPFQGVDRNQRIDWNSLNPKRIVCCSAVGNHRAMLLE